MLNNEIRFYEIGGLVFCLEMPTFRDTDELALFRTDEKRCDYRYVFDFTDKLIVPSGELLFTDGLISCYVTDSELFRTYSDERDGKAVFVERTEENTKKILFDSSRNDLINSMLALEVMDIPSRIIESSGLILHSSFIEVNGEAILFTGHKQIGKSTQAALWQKHRGARIVNGDRAVIRRKDGKWYAWGTPYCGTSKICHNFEFPLKAIVTLSQSQLNCVETNDIKSSFMALLDGASFNTWNTEQVEILTNTCAEIIADIPFLSLACTPDERAVKALEDYLWIKNK